MFCEDVLNKTLQFVLFFSKTSLQFRNIPFSIFYLSNKVTQRPKTTFRKQHYYRWSSIIINYMHFPNFNHITNECIFSKVIVYLTHAVVFLGNQANKEIGKPHN